MRLNHLKTEIENKILGLKEYCINNKASILSEDDLKCHLFNRLLEIELLNTPRQTADPDILGNSLHAELPWYNDDEKLTIRPDLTILEPQELSINRSMQMQVKLPSKQCSFAGHAIVFEIKFCKYNSGITKNFAKKISEDYDKVTKLFQMHRNDIFGYLIIFSRYDKQCAEFEHLKRKCGDYFKIVYLNDENLFS